MAAANADAGMSESRMRSFFTEWEAATKTKNYNALASMFAPAGEMVFRSPAVHKPYTDQNEIMMLLGNVLEIIVRV